MGLLVTTFLIFFCNYCYAYYVNEDGKKIPVDRNVANMIDDIEMKEGEALSQKQIINIVKNSSGSSIEEL